MKLRILTEVLDETLDGTVYSRIEHLFNQFAEAYHIVKVEVCDTGDMVAYHVFYNEKPWRD